MMIIISYLLQESQYCFYSIICVFLYEQNTLLSLHAKSMIRTARHHKDRIQKTEQENIFTHNSTKPEQKSS